MKIKIFRALFLASALAIAAIQNTAAEESPIDHQIQTSGVFRTPLEIVGTASAAGESKALLAALGQFKGNIKSGLAASEAFLKSYPDSPWAPSLRVNLAEYYRANGQYSLALDHHSEAIEKHQSHLTRY